MSTAHLPRGALREWRPVGDQAANRASIGKLHHQEALLVDDELVD
mgnify:CR=1 FL=1